MNILYIITKADGGGAQKYVLEMAKAFNGDIAAGTEAEKLFNDAESLSLKTHRLKYLKRNVNLFYDFFAIFEIYSLIKKLKPDIVHLNSSKAGFLGSFAGKLAGVKVVFTAHGFRFNESFSPVEKQLYKDLERLASMCRDYIIAVSKTDEESALNAKTISLEKISVINNGIPTINFIQKSEAKKTLGLTSNKFLFGSISNFYKTKGLDILIQAIAQLSQNIKDKCQFAIIGDGIERANLEMAIAEHSLENTIKLLGKKDSASTYLNAFDCFVLPSRKEGFPFSLLEAMQAGIPIIASDVGGVKEALSDAGILIEPENPKALADALTDLINDEQKRKDLSQKALERSKLFTLDKMIVETKRIYQNLF